MSAESREKARENGQKSGKGSQLLSKVIQQIKSPDDESS
jgi:hypothetical protein